MISPSSGDAFARRRAATAGRGAVRLRRATFPLMGGKVFGHNLHSRLTGRVHLAGFRKYWRRAMPARISAAGFSCPGRGRLLCVLGRGGTAIDEPAWRFLDRRSLAVFQRAAAVSGFRTAAHFQPDASPRSRSAVRFERLTVRIPSSQPAIIHCFHSVIPDMVDRQIGRGFAPFAAAGALLRAAERRGRGRRQGKVRRYLCTPLL